MTSILDCRDKLNNLTDLIHTCCHALEAAKGCEHVERMVLHTLYFYAIREIEQIEKDLEKI